MITWSVKNTNTNLEEINGIAITESPTAATWRGEACWSTLTCDEKPSIDSDFKNGWWSGAKTFTFSNPVTNPYLVLFSMSSDFGANPLIIQCSVAPTIYCNAVNGGCSASLTSMGVQISGTNYLVGSEGFGIVRFEGTYSSITLTTSGDTGDSGAYKWGYGTLDLVTPTPTISNTPSNTPTVSITSSKTPTTTRTPTVTKTNTPTITNT